MKTLTGRYYSWADKKAGWVTLDQYERQTLFLLMRTFKSPKIEEIEIELFKGGRKKKFFRLYVDNMSLAYEFLRVARIAKW